MMSANDRATGHRFATRIALVTCLSVLGPAWACGDDEGDPASEGDKASDEDAAKSNEAGEPAAGQEGGEGDDGDDEIIDDDEPEVEAAPIRSNRTGIEKYKFWSPVTAFLRAPVTNGAALGSTDAIVVTKDNHVGVTRDAGQNWVFSRHTNGYVLAVGGYEGGPWIAVGSGGYIASSTDGSEWTSWPRVTSEDLVAVHAGPLGIFAAGKKGAVVHYDKDGSNPNAGRFPDKFKAYAFVQDGDMLVASAGKKAYGSIDGTGWAQLGDPPAAPGGKVAATSAGVCSIGKVTKKKKGVVCSVRGEAHGLAGGATAVVNGASVAVTRDGGETWAVGSLPRKGVNGVFGKSGGPYYAVGRSGLVMTSDDAVTWNALEFEETATMWSGMFDGATGLIVGERGTILVTKDGGESWDYAESPVAGKFRWVGKVDGNYIATDGNVSIRSADGKTWTEIEGTYDVPSRSVPCEGMPEAGTVCAYTKVSTTPPELGAVRSFRFDGDRGLAMGDAGLVAITSDGGANWRASGGLGLGAIRAFDVRGDKVIATDGRAIAVSNNGGTSFFVASLDAKKPDIYAVKILASGVALAGGKNGSIFNASGDFASWSWSVTAPKNRTTYVAFHEVGDLVFAAGSKGELWRSEDGLNFAAVVPSLPQSLVALAGDGEHLFGLTRGERRYKVSSSLVESYDGGEHFAVVGKPYVGRGRNELSYKNGKLYWDRRVSEDGGQSWTRDEDAWGAAQELFDGSDKRISLRNGGEETGGLFIHEADKKTVTELTNVYAQRGQLRCFEDTGCWILAGGTLYRPSP